MDRPRRGLAWLYEKAPVMRDTLPRDATITVADVLKRQSEWCVTCDSKARKPHPRCERRVRLAVRLGYEYCGREDLSIPLPRSTFVLPMKPFTVIWPFVIIRELVLGPDGNAILDRRYRETVKRKVRLIPRH